MTHPNIVQGIGRCQRYGSVFTRCSADVYVAGQAKWVIIECKPHFTAAQLADPHVAESEKILRKCVHCGFCTATCPTYVTLGNELDSARAGEST